VVLASRFSGLKMLLKRPNPAAARMLAKTEHKFVDSNCFVELPQTMGNSYSFAWIASNLAYREGKRTGRICWSNHICGASAKRIFQGGSIRQRNRSIDQHDRLSWQEWLTSSDILTHQRFYFIANSWIDQCCIFCFLDHRVLPASRGWLNK
jgi:hypothetical protein